MESEEKGITLRCGKLSGKLQSREPVDLNSNEPSPLTFNN